MDFESEKEDGVSGGREARIMNGRVLKLGALGVLAVNLFFRGFGVSGNPKSNIQNPPKGLKVGTVRERLEV